jgi:chromosomal replication initiator protein
MSQDPQELWAHCLLSIEKQIRPQSFSTWFRPAKAKKFNQDLLELEVPSAIISDWIENNYLELIQRVIKAETGLSPKISFSITANELTTQQGSASEPPRPATQPPSPKPAAGTPDAQPFPIVQGTLSEAGEWSSSVLFTPLNERYTFDTFVIGEGNRFSHAAAQAVAKSPGKTQFNPLVIYGGVGLGKTHLLQAIGHYALARKTAERVAYVPSEKFMSNFIEAIKTRNTAEFQRLYRNADILLIDDIQFLLKGEHTQNEFFHTFNALHQNGKQIAMTCDSPPGELEGLEERLISRFKWGLVTSIEPPDLETRIAILHQKAEISGIPLPDDVASFLGNFISSNIRELEGALNHLMAFCAVHQVELSVEVCRKIIQERLPARSSHLGIEAIQQAVADHFGIAPELLIGKTRKQEIALARQVAMYLAKRLTQNPLKVIGLHFGNRDHTTVIHAVQTVEKKCLEDPNLAHLVDVLSASIQQRQGPL